MTLNQIAQQAMDYLDSVGVAADYKITNGFYTLEIITDHNTHSYFRWLNCESIMADLKNRYPQKSPA